MNITIVTVVLNDKKNIEKTIQSVLNQNIEIEYIVVDGGSTDGTLEVIEKYKNKIDVLISEKDSGIYNAMNKAIDLANGKWLCFMNSGDVFYDTNVLKNLFLNLDDCTDVVYGDWEINYANKTRIANADLNVENIWKNMIFSHQSSFIRKDILNEYRFNESNRITADYELFYNFYKANKQFKYVPMIIASISAGGLSDVKRIESIVSRWNIIDKNFSVNIYYLKLIIIEMIKPYIKKILKK